MPRSLALGIHWAHDASAAICSPGGIVFAVAEERLARIKHYYGFPYRAIEAALRFCGVKGADIGLVAFSTNRILFPRHTNFSVVNADGTVGLRPRSGSGSPARDVARRVKRAAKQVLQGRPALERPTDIGASWGGFEDRHWSKYEDFLSGQGLLDEDTEIYYVAHHRAHAASAFRLSGLEEACVITMDGKGDGLSATIYAGHRDGRLELLRSSRAQDSLGSFYQAVTEALGFIPVDGEYKTMGLAALGNGHSADNPFSSVVSVVDGVYNSTIPWTYRSFNEYNPTMKVANPLASVAETEEFKTVLEDMSREQFAYFAQAHCEENMLAYTRDAIRLTGCDNVVAAGGVMLNVKGNALIRDELDPSHLFVFPDSGDSGLAAGAAMEALQRAGAIHKNPRFRMPYLGHGFDDDEIRQVVFRYKSEHGLEVSDAGDEVANVVAGHLVQGRVVGTFQGRLEMGPRALGNRSVLADARSNQMKDRINLILKGREYFVPFAPAVLEEDANLYWDGATDYRYMTITVNASEYARKTVPAVVHVDGTMRPQVVSRGFNRWLYDVLKEYKKRTGVGLLINTSFNRHGVPIIASPADALDHLVNGWVDAVIVGRWYVERAGSLSDAQPRRSART